MGHWINSYGFYELEMKEVGGVSSTKYMDHSLVFSILENHRYKLLDFVIYYHACDEAKPLIF